MMRNRRHYRKPRLLLLLVAAWEWAGLAEVSSGVRRAAYTFAMALVIGWLAWWVLQREGPRRRFHGTLLRLPIISRLTRGVNTARFTRTLSILAGSGVPILQALKISAEVVENLPMREAITEATVRVREGASISKSLAASKLFPPMMIHLIASGEAGGKLEEMLQRSAAGQERIQAGLFRC